MKLFLLICFLISGFTVIAQRANISNDTAYYLNKAYYIGDTLQLMYGSGNNKDFAFVTIGSGMGGHRTLPAKRSKAIVVVDKVETTKGKVELRGKIPDEWMGTDKIFIDLEGAIDNKEIKE